MEVTHGDSREYHGHAAAFWFLLGIILIEILSVSYLYERSTEHGPQPKFDDYNHNITVMASQEKSPQHAI